MHCSNHLFFSNYNLHHHHILIRDWQSVRTQIHKNETGNLVQTLRLPVQKQPPLLPGRIFTSPIGGPLCDINGVISNFILYNTLHRLTYHQREKYSRRGKYSRGTYVTNFSRQRTISLEILFRVLNLRKFRILNKKKVWIIIINSVGKYPTKISTLTNSPNFCQPPASATANFQM
jgi:hypothetical protein